MASAFEIESGSQDRDSLIHSNELQEPRRQARRGGQEGTREAKAILSAYVKIFLLLTTVILGLLVYRFGTGNESQSEFRGEMHVRKPLAPKDTFEWSKITIEFLDRVAAGRAQVDAQIRAIEEEWDVPNFPVFLETIHMPRNNFELQVNKFRLKLFDLSQNNDSSFVVGISGSSVTAGHDNYYSQSYAHVLEETLEPVFTSLQLHIEVRNRAMGNNPCMPYDLCMPTFFGRDLDVLTWEQSMFCGHDSRPVEAFTRSAFYMDQVKLPPTVIYLSSGTPFWEESDCDPVAAAQANKTTPMLHRGPLSTKELETLDLRERDYAGLVARQTYLSDFTFLHGKTSSIDEVYAGLPVLAQSVLGIQKFMCQGPYSPDFSKRGASGGNAWHPGVKGHRYRAHSLAYPLLKALAQAMDDFISRCQELKGQSRPASPHLAPYRNLRNGSITQQEAYGMSHPPPTTVTCDAKVCLNGEPKCYTDFLPRQDASPLQPASKYTGLLVAQLDNFLTRVASPTSLTGRVIGGNSLWTQELSFFDRHAVEKGEAAGLGYQDRKLILVSPANKTGAADAAISLRIQVSAENSARHGGIVWLCELQKGFLQYPDEFGDLDTEAIAAITLEHSGDGALSQTAPQYVPIIKTEDFCYELRDIKPGSHALTLWPRGTKRITLAYLITF